MATTTRTITIPPQLDPVAVLGPVDEVIREVERAFPVLTIIVRGNRVAIVSRSKQTEAQAAQAEDLVNTIIQAAYTAPMDADTVRRMLDQNVLKNHVRLEHPGHGPVRDKLAQSTSNERAHARSAGSHDPTYRKPTVPGVITFAAGDGTDQIAGGCHGACIVNGCDGCFVCAVESADDAADALFGTGAKNSPGIQARAQRRICAEETRDAADAVGRAGHGARVDAARNRNRACP